MVSSASPSPGRKSHLNLLFEATRVLCFHATGIYNGTSDDWQHWDFDSLTTIAVWSIWQLPAANWSMLCKAHAHGVRVVFPSAPPTLQRCNEHSGQIMNATARHARIQAQVAAVAAPGLDGVNFDIEGQYNVSSRSSLTSLVCETQQALQRGCPPHPARQ